MATSATEAPTPVDDPTQAQRSSRLSTAVPGIALAALIIGICAWPLANAKVFSFADWFVHLWYVWHQEGSLRAHGLPSLFAHDAVGVFDPHFAFYGGTLYTIAGAASLVLLGRELDARIEFELANRGAISRALAAQRIDERFDLSANQNFPAHRPLVLGVPAVSLCRNVVRTIQRLRGTLE